MERLVLERRIEALAWIRERLAKAYMELKMAIEGFKAFFTDILEREGMYGEFKQRLHELNRIADEVVRIIDEITKEEISIRQFIKEIEKK